MKGNVWSHQVWIHSGHPDLEAGGTHPELQEAEGGGSEQALAQVRSGATGIVL